MPLVTSTSPSWSRTAFDCRRPTSMLPVAVKVLVAGLYSSALVRVGVPPKAPLGCQWSRPFPGSSGDDVGYPPGDNDQPPHRRARRVLGIAGVGGDDGLDLGLARTRG